MQMKSHFNRYWWLLFLFSVTGLVIITVGVVQNADWIRQFDHVLQQMAVNERHPERTRFFAKLSFWGTPTINLIACLILASWFWFRHNRFWAGWALTAQIGINTLTYIFKVIIQRARPIGKLITQGGYSFPSGHTSSTATLALILLFLVVPSIRGWFWQVLVAGFSIIWLFMMGIDRIYLFVHYPSDVVAGLLLALVWWAILRISIEKVNPNQQE